MSALGQIRAHGGQGAVAGRIAAAPQVTAILRGTTSTIRVWNGCAGKREEFTVDEARMLCIAGDGALLVREHGDKAAIAFDCGAVLFVGSGWLVAFLAAVGKALRTHDAAVKMAVRG